MGAWTRREDLVPALEELGSRWAADLKTYSSKHVLKVLGDTGMDLGTSDRREDIGASP